MPNTDNREWGVGLKVRVSANARQPSPSQLDRLLEALPGPDKKLTGGGADFTLFWWVRAADAAAATRVAAEAVRRIARSEGLPELTFIRARAASVESRFPAFSRAESHLDAPNEWAVDFKAFAPPGAGPATPALLQRVRAAMNHPDVAVTLRGDPEKFLLDDGSGFTVRFWAAGATPVEAFRSAHRSVLAALADVGLGGWTLVRFKAGTPRHKHEDAFPGAAGRVPEVTEETR